MDFFELIAERHSIRNFLPKNVEKEKLKQIIMAANRAPSAGNLQAYEIFVIKQRDRRNELAQAAFGQWFVAEAPLVLVFCAHPARSAVRYGRRGERLYSLQDTTIACSFAMLAVYALGLSTVWTGAFNEAAVREIIGAPAVVLPIAMLPIGYGAEGPHQTTRRQIDDLVHFES